MSVKVTAYEITCAGCDTELGTHHEFIAQSMDSGVVIDSFFGLIHACEGVTAEDLAQAKENVQWGPWSPDRRRQQARHAGNPSDQYVQALTAAAAALRAESDAIPPEIDGSARGVYWEAAKLVEALMSTDSSQSSNG